MTGGRNTMSYQKENLLHDKEKILWEGRPERYGLFSKVTARELVVKSIIVLVAILSVAYLFVNRSEIKNPSFIWIPAAIGVIAVGSFLIKRPQAMRQRYMMTDQRIFLMKPGNAYYMELAKIDGYQFVTDKSDYPSLVFGKEIYRDIPSHLLWRVCTEIPTKDISSELAETSALVFFNVKNGAELDRLLKDAGVRQD